MTEQILVLWFRRQQNTSALSVEFSFSQLWASLLSLILFFIFGFVIRSPGKVTSGPPEGFWLGCVAVVVEWCHLIGW